MLSQSASMAQNTDMVFFWLFLYFFLGFLASVHLFAVFLFCFVLFCCLNLPLKKSVDHIYVGACKSNRRNEPKRSIGSMAEGQAWRVAADFGWSLSSACFPFLGRFLFCPLAFQHSLSEAQQHYTSRAKRSSRAQVCVYDKDIWPDESNESPAGWDRNKWLESIIYDRVSSTLHSPRCHHLIDVINCERHTQTHHPTSSRYIELILTYLIYTAVSCVASRMGSQKVRSW